MHSCFAGLAVFLSGCDGLIPDPPEISFNRKKPVGPSKTAEQAIAKFQKMGGTVLYDESQTGRPLHRVLLSGIDVHDAQMTELKLLPPFPLLGLADTPLTDAGFKHLRELTALQSTALRELDISGTKITDVGLSNLQGLINLRSLKIGNTGISDAGLHHLKNMTSLRELILGDTRISDAGMKSIAEFTQLEILFLDETAVTDAGLKPLRKLNQLKFLNLESTRVTDDGVQKLRQALPHCEIRH